MAIEPENAADLRSNGSNPMGRSAAMRADADITTMCHQCRSFVTIDRAAGTTYAAGGSQGSLTYADDALLVWDCPACEYTNAEDLAEV